MAQKNKRKRKACSDEAQLAAIFFALIIIVALVQFTISLETSALYNVQHTRKRVTHANRSLALVTDTGVRDATTSSSYDRSFSQAAKATVPHAVTPEGWRPHLQPVDLELRLTDSVRHQPAFESHESTLRQYGFNLQRSNEIPLAQKDWPDVRNEQCKARKWPPLSEMPKVSVVIIFYNEPLSTLLRNVVGVLNRSPPELLGEVLLVDDHSKLDELSLLPEHLERLQRSLPPGKVRLVRRDIHNGIVGARNKGAEEAKYPILVILDSHAQVCDGWLEPLVGRIHADRKRVVVPNLSGINIETLEIAGGQTWPPLRGSFNWRLTFDIIRADSDLDIIESDVPKKASAIKSPVMPGGLFAMDRAYFFELGRYDPEILYYGAEHVEMSFRIWMCGGSMEIMPCSNIGHIYREFDRFAVDNQLQGVDIGHQLNVNDARVAEVWMDTYKELFYTYRGGLPSVDLGDMQPRKDLRSKLQCKSFQWFLDNVVRDMYAPDFKPKFSHMSGAGVGEQLCVDGCHCMDGPLQMRGCDRSISSQQVYYSSKGYLEYSTLGQKHICIRTSLLSQIACSSDKAARTRMTETGEIKSLDKPGTCFSRMGDELALSTCDGTGKQRWLFKEINPGKGTLSDKEFGVCLDNMQKVEGRPGLYGCHGGDTQQWKFTPDGKITAATSDGRVCLGIVAEVGLGICIADDPGFKWTWEGKHLKPALLPELCVERLPTSKPAQECRPAVKLAPCGTTDAQDWSLAAL